MTSLSFSRSGLCPRNAATAAAALKPLDAARNHRQDCREKDVARSSEERSEGGGGKEEAGVLQHLLVGALAGGVSRSVMAPL